MLLAIASLIAYIITGTIAVPHAHPKVPNTPSTSNIPNIPSIPGTRCTHTAKSRACWGDFDLFTNYYEEAPDTGVIREYWFNVVNTTAAPDGINKVVLSINGSIPGPTIIADWGDTVVVHVTNSLNDNGTSIHWHGVRQNFTNYMDGVPSITQCPIAPGRSFTYKWRATQYGSSWYHSHYTLQTWDGLFGGIHINGPATANYDEDRGNLFLSDWSHKTTPVLALEAGINGPPTLNNGLINGTNSFNGNGSRFEMSFTAGTSYRLRVVNAAADTHFRFTIDNHILTVISIDFVPIVPYNTTNISIGIGQRYDVIIYTNTTTTGDFWIRAIPQNPCSLNENVENIRGILRYDSTSILDPVSIAYAMINACDGEEAAKLVPYLSLPASPTFFVQDKEEVNLLRSATNTVLWSMNGTSFAGKWNYPTLTQVAEGNNTWTTAQHVVHLPRIREWVYFIITTNFPREHPIHMHGHDFWILASGTGAYNEDNVTLQLIGGPRRDVAILPALGYLVIALYTDNPGAWLLHCHIAWHSSEGFALQLLERETEISASTEALVHSARQTTCDDWNIYAAGIGIEQDDSGI